jgi:hypothetical protein
MSTSSKKPPIVSETNVVTSPKSTPTRPKRITDTNDDINKSFKNLTISSQKVKKELKDTKSSKEKEDKKYGLNDFVIERTLGTGSFGRVHLIKMKETGHYCAMKVIH